MNNLIITGTNELGEFSYTGIVGGFGANEKSILVKDIAKIHGQDTHDINNIINKNRQYFDDDIDLIDLKQDEYSEFLETVSNRSSYNRRTVSVSNHIYLLSMQGYSLLLKFLKGEKAILIYKDLVNDYFKSDDEPKEYKEHLGTLFDTAKTLPEPVQTELIFDDLQPVPKPTITEVTKLAELVTDTAVRDTVIAKALDIELPPKTLALNPDTSNWLTASQIASKFGVKLQRVGDAIKRHNLHRLPYSMMLTKNPASHKVNYIYSVEAVNSIAEQLGLQTAKELAK